MTKYFCDVCGKEVESITQYVIPDWGVNYITDKKDNKIQKTLVTVPKEKDLCKQCASSIHQLVHIYQYALINNLEKITITLPEQDYEVTK